MTKLPALALAALLGLGAAASFSLPAQAANIASCQDELDSSNPTGVTQFSTEQSSIIAGLRDKGINVQDISDWGGCVKATVVRKDGTVAQQFFDPSTLQRLYVNHG